LKALLARDYPAIILFGIAKIPCCGTAYALSYLIENRIYCGGMHAPKKRGTDPDTVA
jgi:hypothetical protein